MGYAYIKKIVLSVLSTVVDKDQYICIAYCWKPTSWRIETEGYSGYWRQSVWNGRRPVYIHIQYSTYWTRYNLHIVS
jgi:hypothetical protein